MSLTYPERIHKLLTQPSYFREVLPFVKSRIKPIVRRLLELFGHVVSPYDGFKGLNRHIRNKGGFFVHVGGGDGLGNDPTYYLERKLGWKGVIVEARGDDCVRCKKNRPNSTVIQAACGSFKDFGERIRFVDVNGMSFVEGAVLDEKEWIKAGETSQKMKAKEMEVCLIPLQVILDGENVKKIELLVLDVEGYELNVLKGLDFQKNRSNFVLVESVEAKFKPIKAFLNSYSYIFIDRFGNDYLFKNVEN